MCHYQGQRNVGALDQEKIQVRQAFFRIGVKKDKEIPSMEKLNISLLLIVSLYLLHPETSELLLPLPNQLLVQLLRTLASFPLTLHPGPSTFLFNLDYGASTSCTCQLISSRSSLTASPLCPPQSRPQSYSGPASTGRYLGIHTDNQFIRSSATKQTKTNPSTLRRPEAE